VNDYELGMKMVEEEDLFLFLDAYEVVTGQKLGIAVWGERPDFICRRPNGKLVGVELTAVRRDPESAVADRIMRGSEFADEYETLDRIFWAIERKDRKRGTGDWRLRRDTILVLQLMDCPLSELSAFLEDADPSDFGGHGFKEVWIADHSELDAYGNVELFGLYPRRLWGHFEIARGKPYG
jgi:hypothetical protein